MDTLEEVKLILKELGLSQAKSEKELRELRESQAKTDQQIKNTEIENEKGFRELRESIKEVHKELGDIGKSQGDMLEYSFFTSLREKLFLDNIKYDKIYTKLKNKNHEKEFDIILENSKHIAVIEIKTFTFI